MFRIRENAVAPVKPTTWTDSGYDVTASKFIRVYDVYGECNSELGNVDELMLQPGERTLIGTGWAMSVPAGFEIQVRARSGLSLKHGLAVVNSPGTVDCSYRQEVGVILANNGRVPVTIKIGERIAQVVIAPVALVPVIECDSIGHLDDLMPDGTPKTYEDYLAESVSTSATTQRAGFGSSGT